ncbi:hypothetical protein [Aquabacterium sp.]|uniref:hypothetical protein n=1 Tax=Aquabacterium sp. TaxID=1872578 RepID=UPI0040379600
MDNPFKKRRTELITDRRTLLSLVSSVPIEEFFEPEKKQLLEKLTLVVGTPGCGKTTIAQVVEFESLYNLCQGTTSPINRDLVDVLTGHELIKDGLPAILGHRLAMSTNFRDIWELPYSDQTRLALLRAFLQSKAVLGWFSQLDVMGVSLEHVEIMMGANSESVFTTTGADRAERFREYARSIELAIFKIVTSLVPPDEKEMAESFLNTSYDVFEVLSGFRVRRWPGAPDAPIDSDVILRPMIIVDDAHELHPMQFTQLRDWLKTKAMGVSRWLMCRPDVVSADDYRDALIKDTVSEEDMQPGSIRDRDYIMKLMQLGTARRFKHVATDIATRYIASIPEFRRRGISDLKPLLNQTATAELAPGVYRQLQEKVEKLAQEARFSKSLVESLHARVRDDVPADESQAALRILIYREKNKTPQIDLLGDDELLDEPASDDKKVNSTVLEGARVQLMHEFDRPYYFGMDKLIAASNSNIEQFVRLAGTLVDELLARVIRNREPYLAPKAQHVALVGQAKQAMNDWDFPYNAVVRALVKEIATQCLAKTLQGNAPLGAGANAIGIPQEEMDAVLRRDGRLARVLHFAFAYNALVFVPSYRCKNKVWCLLELGALPNLAYGLTLNRGGFIESTLRKLQAMVPEEGA